MEHTIRIFMCSKYYSQQNDTILGGIHHTLLKSAFQQHKSGHLNVFEWYLVIAPVALDGYQEEVSYLKGCIEGIQLVYVTKL